MTPVWGTRIRPSLRPSSPANLTQDALDKGPRVWHHGAGLAYLRHGGGDQVGLHEFDLDVVGCQFGAKGGRPLLQEGLATAVCCKEGRREQTAKGAHRDDQPALPLHHARSHKLRHSQCSDAIDGDDGVDFRLLRLGEGYWYRVAGSHVVDQDSNVQAIGKCLELGVIVVVVGCKIHSQGLGGGIVL